jgi:hypothetical protein
MGAAKTLIQLEQVIGAVLEQKYDTVPLHSPLPPYRATTR